jgi:membrane-associated phospholipid phosphatase
MGGSLVLGRWHTLMEVVGGAALALIVTLFCFRIYQKPDSVY